jgi:hypothetical protein
MIGPDEYEPVVLWPRAPWEVVAGAVAVWPVPGAVTVWLGVVVWAAARLASETAAMSAMNR